MYDLATNITQLLSVSKEELILKSLEDNLYLISDQNNNHLLTLQLVKVEGEEFVFFSSELYRAKSILDELKIGEVILFVASHKNVKGRYLENKDESFFIRSIIKYSEHCSQDIVKTISDFYIDTEIIKTDLESFFEEQKMAAMN